MPRMYSFVGDSEVPGIDGKDFGYSRGKSIKMQPPLGLEKVALSQSTLLHQQKNEYPDINY